MLRLTDGSSTDVSFHSAIDGRNERRERLEALRRGVEGEILDFRASVFMPECSALAFLAFAISVSTIPWITAALRVG